MKNLSEFCTCRHFDCPLHPTKHDQGCAPCIAKNLQTEEMPTCFFDKIKHAENRKSDSFADFARLVLEAAHNDTQQD